MTFGDVTLREWLTRFQPERDGVWGEVVTEFDARAAGDERTASYFDDIDLVGQLASGLTGWPLRLTLTTFAITLGVLLSVRTLLGGAHDPVEDP